MVKASKVITHIQIHANRHLGHNLSHIRETVLRMFYKVVVMVCKVTVVICNITVVVYTLIIIFLRVVAMIKQCLRSSQMVLVEVGPYTIDICLFQGKVTMVTINKAV